MTHLLHLDASARPGLAGKDEHGSHSRNLSQHFVSQWLARRPQDGVTYRDIGQNPPSFVSHDWIASAFTPEERREPWMNDALAESDRLVDELLAADVLVIGTPLYNFGMPAALKAWIDHVVRVGITFLSTAAGKVGTVVDRPVYVAVASGGYISGPNARQPDFLRPYLSAVLATIGLKQVNYFTLEGTARGAEFLQAARAAAQAEVQGFFAASSKPLPQGQHA